MELSPQQYVYYIDTVSPIDYFIDTVTPSAIQLNKEKIMSIELDGPLYLGSNSLQQQVDQNTEDITELQSDVSSIEGDIGSLDNLATSDKSSLVNAINETLSVLDPTQTADYIKNSKGLKSGEISTNASILPWVEDMSHSTFDASKFTVVGSPSITDDGIASGFSSGANYIQTSTAIDFSKPFEIYSSFKLNDITSSTCVLWKILGSTYNNNLTIRPTSNSLDIYLGTNNSLLGLGISNINYIPNVTYQTILGWDGTTYYLKIKAENETTWKENTTSSNLPIDVSSSVQYVAIGKLPAATSINFTGSIDLKQFSITVDGVEVFSGNKTGIDTIKPDNYTVVGTPTISADGVASGFGSRNYLMSPIPTFTNDLIIKGAFTYEGTGYAQIYNLTVGNTTETRYGLTLYITGTKRLVFQTTPDGTSWGGEVDFNTTIQNNQKYYFKLIYNGTTITPYLSTDGINYTQEHEPVIRTLYTTYGSSRIGLGSLSQDAFIGSIDLNAFKIYADGNLVYQPCLKIPFTLSKTGAKIVDSIYRDRVTDMYEQFGYAPYYTLDTTNSNYTIPKGEVYGMVNKVVPTLIAPDYSKPVSLTYSSGLVMDNDGWLEVQIQSSEATANPYVSINGSIICRTSVNSNGDLNRDTAMMVVRKGDVITSGGYSADTAIVLTYYPFKV